MDRSTFVSDRSTHTGGDLSVRTVKLAEHVAKLMRHQREWLFRTPNFASVVFYKMLRLLLDHDHPDCAKVCRE